MEESPLPLDTLDLSAPEIARSFEAARKQGHPMYLWPEIPMHAWRSALRELERVTAALLVEPGTPVELLPPPGIPARAFGIAGYTSGMGPLLGAWLEEGRLGAPTEVADLLRLHLAHGRLRSRRAGTELARALDVLGAAGIEAVVLKGAHTARAFFPEPGTRPVADIDLLVIPERAELVARALREAGYTPLGGQRRPYRSDWGGPGQSRELRSLELNHHAAPIDLDIHGSLERDFFGVRRIDLGPLTHTTTRPAPELHPSARVLRGPVLLAYLAAHASEGLHNLTLVRLVELVLVIRCETTTRHLDWDALDALLERKEAHRFVFPALEMAERLAPGTLPDGLRTRLASQATPGMRRVLAGLRPSDAQRLERLSLAERFMWAAGPAEHVRRAAYMLWPQRIGPSWRALSQIYAVRVFRLLHGRVHLRGRG